MAGWLDTETDVADAAAAEPAQPDSAVGTPQPPSPGTPGPAKARKRRGRRAWTALPPEGAVAPDDEVDATSAVAAGQAEASAIDSDAIAVEGVSGAAGNIDEAARAEAGDEAAVPTRATPATGDDPWTTSAASASTLEDRPPATYAPTPARSLPWTADSAGAPALSGPPRTATTPTLATGNPSVPATMGSPAGAAEQSAVAPTPQAASTTIPPNVPDVIWPRTADVLGSLADLAQLYGDETATAPDHPAIPTAYQGYSATSMATTAEQAHSAYLDSVATTYRNLDSALATYLAELAGKNADYQTQVRGLVNLVNAQLLALDADALGPIVTEELRERILAAALADAEQLFEAGMSTATATGHEVNQLAGTYLDALTAATASAGSAPDQPVSGTLGQWIEQAIAILKQLGYPASALNPTALAIVIEHESSGNPHAENLTDSNAAAGDSSKGLMQTISSTFDEYAVPGHTDIWNPVDNIVAGARYAVARYGSLDNIPGVVAVERGGSYVGY
jgi:hypothetical protein